MTTILVIDDDESLRDTIGIMLEQEGFSPSWWRTEKPVSSAPFR
jgi:FixJ family two-component response regulator